ncbi:MAG: VTT domain-containing protein [Parcubacteria group bacterium]|nr:VTT domain-containing protein [Parcubacteria group bacterium]
MAELLWFFGEYKYAFIFIGLIVAGEAVLIPAIYFSFIGRLDLTLVVVVALIATILSDALWYLLGRWGGYKEWTRRRVFGNERSAVQRFSAYFLHHNLIALFLSKFIYGTRIAAQVLSGINKVPFRSYFHVNAIAAAAWIATLVLLGAGFSSGIDELSSTVRVMEQFAGFAVLVLVLLFFIKHIAEKKWFPR